jgi:hypothetical protein
MSRVFGSKYSLLALALIFIGILGVMGCVVDPEPDPGPPPPPPNCRDATIFPDGADYGEYFPEHVAGDCQFESAWKMHGPNVHVEAHFNIDESKTQLWLVCSMAAVETEADFTEARGIWSELIYTAPQGWYINKIGSAFMARGEYTDTDIFWDKIETSMCTFDIMGNTLLNDVCNTIIDGDATRMKIHLNPINIVLCDQKR